MTRSSKKFSVFDFDEEEALVEKQSAKIVDKFRVQKRKRVRDDPSPINKYNFLKCFGGCAGVPKKESSNEPIDIDDGSIDVDTGIAEEINVLCNGSGNAVVDIDANVCNGSGNAVVDIDANVCNGSGSSVVDIDSILDDQCKYSLSLPKRMPQDDGTVKEETAQLGALRLSCFPNYKNEAVGTVSDRNNRIEMSSSTSVSSSSTSFSTLEESEAPFREQMPVSSSCGLEIDYMNRIVVVSPDFILWGEIYSTQACLTFSGSSIRLKGSTVNGFLRTFNSEWTLGDIISIESEWLGMVETAMLHLCLKSKGSEGAGNTHDTAGVDKLKVSICTPCWHEGQEAIKSLDVRYMDNWNIIFDSDFGKDGNALFGYSGMVISKPYFSVVPETLEDVSYPKGDPDAVSFSMRDVELLCPEKFLNDTIIDFYIQYLKNKIHPEDRHRFHFFNSFFFQKLAELDKGPSNACEGRFAFQSIHKWTRKVYLFEKDYIFIPVNYSLHWTLIVICHPGEVGNSEGKDYGIENSLKVPCILHMDSIRGSHRGLKNLIQRYLYEEWKERHKETMDDIASKFLNLRFVPLELPQQVNSFDCGLFLLHYVELFLEVAPINFSPFKITEFSNFLSRNWFPPKEASLKRVHIQKLMCEILENQSSSQFSDPEEQESGCKFIEEKCSTPSGHDTDAGFQISLTPTSSLRVVHQQPQLGEPGFNSMDLFDPATSARSFSNVNCWGIRARQLSSCMSPVEEAEEIWEHIVDSSSDSSLYPENDWQSAGSESPSTLFSPRDLGSPGSSRKQKLRQLEELYDHLNSEASLSQSPKSSEVGVDEDDLHQQCDGFDHDLADCVVEDSQEGNCMMHEDVDNDPVSPFDKASNGNNLAPSVHEFNAIGSFLRKPRSNVDLPTDEKTTKRTKFTTSDGGR